MPQASGRAPSEFKVLIAEDDLIVADMIRATLVERGYRVCGVARTVDEAVALAHAHRPDLAVIDVQLADGGLGTEIVSQVEDFGVLYATASSNQLRPGDGHACLIKPYSESDLVRGLEIVAELVETGTTSLPFPQGFRLLRLGAVTRGASSMG